MELTTREEYFLDTKIIPMMKDWVKALGLEEWDIALGITEPYGDKWAVCWCNPTDRMGRIAFSNRLLDKMEDIEIRWVVGHELIHMLTEPAISCVEAALAQTTLDGYNEEMEKLVNRLTAIVGRAYSIIPNAVP
jgi:hypothetical protein